MVLYSVQATLVYGFILGSIYLLITLGFSLICGVLRIFHLGYGTTFVLAVYVTWALMKEVGLGLVPALGAMILIQIVFALVIIYFPLVRQFFEREEILLTALLLLALIVEEAVNLKYPVIAGVYLPTTIVSGSLNIGGVAIPNQLIVAAAIALVFTFSFIVFLLRSKIGLAMRAASQQVLGAQLRGIDMDRVYSVAMALSVLPPTIGICTIAPVWSVEPQMGWPLLQIAILTSILGGLGNLKGTLIAAYITGLVAAAVSFFVSPRLMGLSILVLVLVILLFRPQGIGRGESLW